MILPDTPLIALPDVEGVIVTEGQVAGDREAEKMIRNGQLRSLYILYVLLNSEYNYNNIHGYKQSN